MNIDNLLYDEQPIVIAPGLAKKIGLNEAILLQYFHLSITRDNARVHGKRHWVRATNEEIQEVFGFWSSSTVKRVVGSLKSQELIIVEQLDKRYSNHANYYTIDYDKYMEMIGKSEVVESSEGSRKSQSNEPVDDGCKSGRGEGVQFIDFDEVSKLNQSDSSHICGTGAVAQNEPIQGVTQGSSIDSKGTTPLEQNESILSSSCCSSNLINKTTTTDFGYNNLEGSTKLILPGTDLVNDSEIRLAQKHLGKLPVDLRQVVADEWHGKLKMAKLGQGKPIHNKMGYLSTLVELALSDRFNPSVAISIMEQRENANEVTTRMEHQSRFHESEEILNQDSELSDEELEKKYSHLPQNARMKHIEAVEQHRIKKGTVSPQEVADGCYLG